VDPLLLPLSDGAAEHGGGAVAGGGAAESRTHRLHFPAVAQEEGFEC